MLFTGSRHVSEAGRKGIVRNGMESDGTESAIAQEERRRVGRVDQIAPRPVAERPVALVEGVVPLVQRCHIEVNASDDGVVRIIADRPHGRIACKQMGHGREIGCEIGRETRWVKMSAGRGGGGARVLIQASM